MTTKRQRLHRLESRADRFERLVAQALRRAIRSGTKNLGLVVEPTTYQVRNARGAFAINMVAAAPQPAEPYVSVDDLAAIDAAWQSELRDLILPELGRTVVEGAHDAIDDLVAKVPVLVDARHAAAELYVSQAENRLRGIGTDLWQKTRAQLVAGMAEGESIPELSKRVRGEIASSNVRARTIARTEVVSASNAGALAQMQSLGEEGPAEKEWLSTNDARTRLSHREANGQQVPLVDRFEVGGATLAFPGDPTGPPDEVINCRCTLVWNMEPKARLVAAGFETFQEEEHTSGMIALVPVHPPTIGGGVPSEESHLTLWFLGPTNDIPEELQQAILAEVGFRSEQLPGPLLANAFGAAVWDPNGEDPCVVLNVGGNGLRDIRDEVHQGVINAPDNVDSNQDAAKAWQMPEQHQPWSPHVCLAYATDPTALIPEALELVGPIEFDRVRVAFGSEVHDFTLGGE